MSSAEDYRQWAVECLAIAERASNIADRDRLIQMAQAFLDLAVKLERKDLPPK
jgi:hypothetical protein